MTKTPFSRKCHNQCIFSTTSALISTRDASTEKNPNGNNICTNNVGNLQGILSK